MILLKSGGKIDKSKMACNKPKRTPSHPTKSHVVKACEDGKEKIIRFGQQGVKGAGKNPKSAKEKARRKSYYARHNAQGKPTSKFSAKYWSHKVKWKNGGVLNQGSSNMLFVLEPTKIDHTLDGWDISKGNKPEKDDTKSTAGYLQKINDTTGLIQVGENIFIKKIYDEHGAVNPEDKEMIEGIADIVRKVKNRPNRREITNYLIKKFKEEGTELNEMEFKKTVNFEKGGMLLFKKGGKVKSKGKICDKGKAWAMRKYGKWSAYAAMGASRKCKKDYNK